MALLHPLVDIHLKCLPLLTISSKAGKGKTNHKKPKITKKTSKEKKLHVSVRNE